MRDTASAMCSPNLSKSSNANFLFALPSTVQSMPRWSIKTASERMGIHSARLAHLRRRIRCQCLAERLILRTIPYCSNAFFDETAEVDAVGRSNHAAWHAQALIAGVGTAPGPIAARWA